MLANSCRQEVEELAFQCDSVISGVCDSLHLLHVVTELHLEKSVT